ncbi:MAG: hypothetical protein ACYCTF_07590 [Acidiferrobacter sp.]
MNARRGYGGGRQGGITLLLSILVLLTLGFIGLGLMDFTGFDNDVSSNAAQTAAALQASDVGLAAASQSLDALPAFPETLNMTPYPWWYNPPVNGSSGSTAIKPVRPPVSFWQGCAPRTCGVVTGWNGHANGVPFGGQTFTVEYVVEPTGLGQQLLNGYEAGSPATPYRLYDAYVYVFRDRPGTQTVLNGTLIEAGIRKEGG